MSAEYRDDDQNLRVALLTSIHPRPDVRVFFREAVTLAEARVDVALVCPEPEWPYPDLGIRIITIPRQVNRFKRMTQAVAGVAQGALASNADIMHLQNPELIPVGLYLKLRGKKVVFDAHEDLPDQIITKGWIPPRLRPVVSLFAKGLIKLADWFFDGIVAATPTIAQDFTPSKTIILRNLPRKSDLAQVSGVPYDPTGPLIYVGGLTLLRGSRELVQAMEYVGAETGRFLEVYGSFASPGVHKSLEQEPGWKWVNFNGMVEREHIATALSKASVGIVTFHDAPNHRRSEPNKLFEYLLAGIPIVTSNFEYWQQFVTEPGTGIQVDPTDPKAIAEALIYLIRNPDVATEMGARGRTLALEKYTWESQSGLLLDLYRKIQAS